MQLDLAMEKELSHDSGGRNLSSNPVRRGYAVISSWFSVSDVEQTPTGERGQKKTCRDSGASTIGAGLRSLKFCRVL
jgi:hypothetical protein